MPGKGQYKRTKEEYLAMLKTKHGDRFVIEDFEYKGSASPIIAHCREHGPFSIQLLDLITSSRGCQSCPAAEPAQKYKRTREDYVRQIEAKYGDKLIVEDDVESEYLGAKTVVTARCPDHGLFTGSLGKILDGSNKCPGCRITVRGRYKRTKQEYLDLIREKHGDKFAIDDFEYEGGETPVTVHCPDHGEFVKTLGKMIGDKHGCPKCALAARGRLLSSALSGKPNTKKYISLDVIKSRIELPDYVEADFSKCESWTKGEVSTTCIEHGLSIWPNAASLSGSPKRCKGCIAENLVRRKPTTFDEFVARANAKYSHRYTYSDDYDYVNLRSHVSAICPDHGPQKIRAGKHVVHGQYCAQCRYEDCIKSGLFPGFYTEAIPFDKSLQQMPGRLYYYQHGSKLKVGITKNTMRERLKGHPDRHKITRVESVEMSMGEAVAIEQYTLRRFADFRITRDWSTELFDRDVLAGIGHDSLESYVEWVRSHVDLERELQRLREHVTTRRHDRAQVKTE